MDEKSTAAAPEGVPNISKAQTRARRLAGRVAAEDILSMTPITTCVLAHLPHPTRA
jgi:hypothetical protein